MKRYIEINLIYEATHNWPECHILEVAYLKNEHRHQFYIKMIKEVSHNDRDIEIILFKTEVENYLAEVFNGKFGRNSCEAVAELLLTKFGCSEVRVLEDSENGAIIKI